MVYLTQALTTKKIFPQDIENEIKLLRSSIISIIGKDKEGEYKPEFIKEMFKVLKEKPVYLFRDKQSFLKKLREND